MNSNPLKDFTIDYVEIYTPMAKALAYWHAKALGFKVVAYFTNETGSIGMSSYVLKSNNIRLVLTSSYPVNQSTSNNEVSSFISQNYCGVKRFALRTSSVKELFEYSISNGAIPIKFPTLTKDDLGYLEEAAIKFYDQSEIVFVNRDFYKGAFKPGYVEKKYDIDDCKGGLLTDIDHIASEVRINEINYWTDYVTKVIGTQLVQSIKKSQENKTGIVLNINQSLDKKLTLVMAEPETYLEKTKTQQNVDSFGPGIHHLAFSTNNILETIKQFSENEVEFVNFPSSYYQLLRESEDFIGFDINELERYGILIDKEGDAYLLQKFIKPISDRPFFFYEIVQRVNGYNGFALKNINVLKKAEELEIMKTDKK